MNTTKTWKRLLSVVLAVVLLLSVAPIGPFLDVVTNAATATKVYMQPNSNWKTDNARFAAYFFGNGEKWVSMTDSDGDGIYEANVPSGYSKVIFVRMNPSNSNNDWNAKWNQTGDLTVPTGNSVLYTISGWEGGLWGPMSFTVSITVSNTTNSGNTTATYGNNYTATLTANSGYVLPASIIVEAGSTTLTQGTHYSYNSSTGAISVNGSAITGKITITGSATTNVVEYNVTFKGVNVNSNGANKATNTADYTAKLSVDTANYSLPASITVTAGGKTLTNGTEYKYVSSSGDLTIYTSKISGDIVITAEAGLPSYKVTFNGSHVNSNGATSVVKGNAYTATLTAADGYNLPKSIIVTVGGKDITGFIYSNGSLNIPSTYITGDIVITAIGEVKPVQGWNIYLKPGNNWREATPRFAVYYWPDGGDGLWVNMTATSDGYYTATIPENCTNVIFGRFSSGNSTNSFDENVIWNRTGNLKVPYDNALFTVGDDQWGNATTGATGSWSEYSGGGSVIVPSEGTYYVNADIVDYLNDYRVNSGAALGYSNDNQGIWMDAADNPVYSYLNYIIAQQEGYTYPLYFGNMLFISNRYGVRYTAFNVGDYTVYDGYRKNGKENLTNWNTGANVALNTNGTFNAVVQGLVGAKLDQYGQLTDPKNPEKQLFYFDKTSIESWKTSDGTKSIAAYYENLKFPFSTTFNPNTHVTTYSYNSAKDDAVFIDYDKYDPNSKSNPMYSNSSHAVDEKGGKGFFPLNKPGDSGNDTNYAFGTKFTIDFTVSDDGVIVANDNTQTPVKFSFTGDDDVWVFIDGYLVLDMGGAHTMASGTINFQDLTATVSQAAQVSNTYYNPSFYNNAYGYDGDGVQRDNLTVQNNLVTKFPEELAAKFQTEYTTGISQVHTLTMFYMERGGIESNMSIEFSMSPIPTGLTVSKDIENVNPGLNADVQDDDEFNFTIEAEYENTRIPFDGYDLTDHGSITTNMTSSNNGITGVRGDRYANNFTYGGLPAFTAGTSFTITEGAYSSKYSGTRWVVYEYSNGYEPIAISDPSITKNMVAKFDTDENSSGNYAVNFINILNAGSLTLTKKYLDTLISSKDMEFEFQIWLDLDGDGTKNAPKMYPGLTYDLYEDGVLVAANQVSEKGSIFMKANQTVKINGIPWGTTYEIVEVDDSALWETASSTNPKGIINEENQSVTAAFVNKTTSNTMDEKVIYVEAGKDTNYTIKDGDKVITVNSTISSSDEMNVSVSNGKVVVNGSKANAEYTFDYAGSYPNGSYVSGQVTVYTFAATNKTYVFDFGMSADLVSDTADGLFTGAVFNNTHVSGEKAALASISKGTQTSITTNLGKTFGENNSYDSVIFKPNGFMSQVENYTYTVNISAEGKTVDPSDPETGVVLTGTIKVMPANTVYYEDNFNVNGSGAENKFVFSGNAPATNFNGMQSIDQSTNYGYDDTYKNGYVTSGGTSTELTHGQYAYFTFTGTGFDLISRTNGASAGMGIFVFAGEHKAENLTFVTSFKGNTPDKMVFVDTYYNNGDLHQVPVASVRMGTYSTYTVYVQALSTTPVGQAGGRVSIEIDGVRIYDPLAPEDRANYPLKAEQNVTIDELRTLYGIDNVVSLAGRNEEALFVGLGKQTVVREALQNAGIIETMEGDDIVTAADVESIYLHGPNNEMYLPTNFGVSFTYTVNSSNWTLQLGAKSVTASNAAKSISVYVRTSGSGSYEEVKTIELNSGNAMYYDLTSALKDFSTYGASYDVVIISNSAFESNEFVSLTTVKHSGITLS